MATLERPEKTKKSKKQPKTTYKYESIALQKEPDADVGDCDHIGIRKSPIASALLISPSASDIDDLVNKNETSVPPSPSSTEQLQETWPSNKRRNTFTAAIRRSMSGFTKNGVENGPEMVETKNDHPQHQRHQAVHPLENSETEAAGNEKPLDVYAMFATKAPLKTDEQTQCDERKRVRAREQMMESLQSLRDVCLQALDRLLSSLLSNSTSGVRLEDDVEGSTQTVDTGNHDSNEDLLRSIYSKSNRLAIERSGSGGAGSHQTPVPNELELSPLTADNGEKYLVAIQERLDACSPPVPSDDFTLTSGLASLLNGVYHIIRDCDVPKETKSANELSLTTDSDMASTSPVVNGASASSNSRILYSTLRQHMALVQDQRAASEGNIISGPASPRSLWRETDRLMELVATLLRDRFETIQKGGSPSCADIASLPSYADIHSSGEHLTGDKEAGGKPKKLITRVSLKSEDISRVLSALDRVMEVVPRMNDQRVNLSDKQQQAIAAASLSKAIVRLSKGRLEGQRADTSGRRQRLDALDLMIDRIAKSSTSQFNDQRVALTDIQTKNLELAKITGVLDRASKNRMDKQEWQSPRQIKEQDMSKLNQQIQGTISPNLESHQRYTISAQKEKEMFMANIMGKMNRLSDRRMEGQDATTPLERKHERFQEIDTVMDRMSRGLDEQKFCKPTSTTSTCPPTPSSAPAFSRAPVPMLSPGRVTTRRSH